MRASITLSAFAGFAALWGLILSPALVACADRPDAALCALRVVLFPREYAFD